MGRAPKCEAADGTRQPPREDARGPVGTVCRVPREGRGDRLGPVPSAREKRGGGDRAPPPPI